MTDHDTAQVAQFDDLGTTLRGELLSAKYLRKKFRRASIPNSNSETSEMRSGSSDIALGTQNTDSAPPSEPDKHINIANQVTTSLIESNSAQSPSTVMDETPYSSLSPNLPETLPADADTLTSSSPLELSPRRSASLEPSSFTSGFPCNRTPVVDISTQPALDAPFPFSPEELDQAKTLVLDLLGWGVEPEYLVTSGVSPVAIFRIFSDLNLHLPTNLEVSEEQKALAYSWGPPPDFSQCAEPTSC